MERSQFALERARADLASLGADVFLSKYLRQNWHPFELKDVMDKTDLPKEEIGAALARGLADQSGSDTPEAGATHTPASTSSEPVTNGEATTPFRLSILPSWLNGSETPSGPEKAYQAPSFGNEVQPPPQPPASAQPTSPSPAKPAAPKTPQTKVPVKTRREPHGSGAVTWQGRFPNPVPGARRISSRFGPRKDPITGELGKLHKGIDLAAPQGTPIHSVASGTVVFSGVMRGYGNCIKVDHGDGTVTLYGHCSSLGVKKGAKVKQGYTIAQVGSTGTRSTGPHCHFEVIANGVKVNPFGGKR